MKLSDIERTVPKILASSQEAPCLVGPPGVGKTSICYGIAERLSEITERSTDILIQHPAYEEPVDGKGIPIPDTNESGIKVMHWIPPDTLPLKELLGDSQRNLLWVLDDIGQAHPQVQNAYSRVFHSGERVVAGRKIHPFVYPLATTNRIEDAAAVFEMPSFARMRMTFIDVDVDAGDFCAWAYKHKDMAEEFISFVHPQNKIGGSKHIFDFDPSRRTNCSPRTLHIASKHWQALKGESVSIVDEYLRGIVCPAFPIEFRAHLRLYELLPDIDAILKGKDVNMDFAASRPDVLHLVLTSLLKRAVAKDIPALTHFMNRVPKSRTDFTVWFFLEVRRKLPAIGSDKDFLNWALANKELLKSA